LKIKKHRVYFALGLVAIMLAALFSYHEYVSINGLVPVAVAARDIGEDTPASSQNVIPGKTPRGAVFNDTVFNPQDLDGMSAKGFIPAGQPIRKSMFQPIKDAGVAARLAHLGGNRVAIGLEASVPVTVGGELKVDYRVDVKSSSKGLTKKLADNAVVLAVPGKNERGVVLAVTPEEASSIETARDANEKISLEILPAKEGR